MRPGYLGSRRGLNPNERREPKDGEYSRAPPGTERTTLSWVRTALAAVVVCLLLMASLPQATWERLVIWMILGLVIYIAYGRRHSRVRTMAREQHTLVLEERTS